MKASDLFVRCLEEEQVEYVFGVPGEENLDLLESLRTSKVKLIVTRHEQHAAFMAATYGRLTGRAGVVLSTLGPGATNLVTGVAYAQLGGMPLVAITGQKAIKDNWQGNFQLVDVVGTFRPLTKWNTSIVSAGSIPRALRHAFKTAENERPGAVHLELPEDVAREDAGDLEPHRRVPLRRPAPDPKAITQAMGYLVLENGIFIFGLMLVDAMPLIVELGVLLDVFVGIFIICIIVNHVNRAFSSLDTRRLATLKE